jgi:transposase
MTSNKLLSRLLKMHGFCVTWLNFASDELLEVGVKPRKTGCRCPLCGRRGTIVCTTGSRRWDDIVVCGRRCVFVYGPREIICDTHGRIQEAIPWADAYSRITYRLEYLILRLCQNMTQKAAAELLHIPQSTLSDLLHRKIERTRADHRITGIEKLGIDEISYRKGKKYATIVYDLERCCVIWVGKGKGRETADRFFKDALSQEQRENIRFASCDMSQAYLGAIKHWCPNSTLVIDRFHLVKALNNAVDDVRKKERRKAKSKDKKVLKGLRWLLYKHSSNRKKSDTRRLNSLRLSNKRIHRAWVLKDEFEAFWEYSYTQSAESFMNGWITTALRSRLPEMKVFALTLRRHAENILPFIKTRLTNAMSEGINRIIKIIKNRASGFANLEAFSDMIFLTIGDLDIPEQIPAHFHTL